MTDSKFRSLVRGPSVWALVRGVFLVIAVPWLVMIVLAYILDAFAVGYFELLLLYLVWVVGIVLVARAWRAQRSTD